MTHKKAKSEWLCVHTPQLQVRNRESKTAGTA